MKSDVFCLVFSTHLKNMRKSNWIISPRVWGENKKCLKPPPRMAPWIYHPQTQVMSKFKRLNWWIFPTQKGVIPGVASHQQFHVSLIHIANKQNERKNTYRFPWFRAPFYSKERLTSEDFFINWFCRLLIFSLPN